jgi:undecaprenyl-diphosphatase
MTQGALQQIPDKTAVSFPTMWRGSWMLWSVIASLLVAAPSYFLIDRLAAHAVPAAGTWPRELADKLTHAGDATGWVVAGVALLAWQIYRRWTWMGMGAWMLGSVAAVGLIVRLIKVTVGRSRPNLLMRDGTYDFSFMETAYAWNSFPSGHASTLGAMCFVMCWKYPRWRPMWIVVFVALASTRVLTLSHFVSDVIVGFVLGMVVAALIRRYLLGADAGSGAVSGAGSVASAGAGSELPEAAVVTPRTMTTTSS